MTLLTYDRYVQLTGDSVTASALVEAAVADAESMVAEHLKRPLESAERIEWLRVDVDGRVYPRAIPVTSVSASSTGVLEDDRTIRDATADLSFLIERNADLGTGYLVDQPLAAVTYTGGWTSDTAPVRLLRVIARAAYNLANPNVAQDAALANSTARKTGDVSVSYGAGGAPGPQEGKSDLEVVAPGAEAALKGWVYSEDYS